MKGFFFKTHSIKSRCDIEAENILFAGMSGVDFQPGNFTDWRGEGVNALSTACGHLRTNHTLKIKLPSSKHKSLAHMLV